MKKPILIVFLLFNIVLAQAQHKEIDSLRTALSKTEADTVKMNVLIELGKQYFLFNPDSSILVAQQAYTIAVKNNRQYDVSRILNIMGNAYATMGDYAKGMQYYLQARRQFEALHNVYGVVMENNNIGATYIEKSDYKNALPYLLQADKQWKPYVATHKLVKLNEREQQAVIYINIGESYLYTHQIDSAEHYLLMCYADTKKNNFTIITDNIERDLGEVEIERGHKDEALKHLRLGVKLSIALDDPQMLSVSYLSTAKLYHKYAQQDSAEYYAKKALEIATTGKYEQDVLNAGKVLYTYYDEDHNLPEAYKYFKLTTAAKDSLYSQDKVKQLLSLDFEERQRQQEIADAQIQYREQVRMYAFIAGLVILLFLVFVFWRNGRQRQKANKLLSNQKNEIERAMSQLQLTQKQLIQSEKMASLGELTAGIAHEIQNPLNFVNNFSEVSMELVDEMENELNNGDKEDAIAIATDIKQNLEKIRHHGKRADGIVKGMLQHSRTGSTTKEPTDINKLADEYLRLAYHGLRAKDKSFNAELITNYSPSLPLIDVLPQDVGRVLLNLYTNAFYAVQQKQQTSNGDYKPTVQVSTFVKNKNVIVTVKDNGMGMPENVKDKIMQPFFTTKPTGEGTGLGLSLSYDIVVKGHGGEINVDTKENDYTEFTISLPL
jgi:two-component system NtrC family sensor kinase